MRNGPRFPEDTYACIEQAALYLQQAQADMLTADWETNRAEAARALKHKVILALSEISCAFSPAELEEMMSDEALREASEEEWLL